MSIKVVVIGGGSSYTPELIEGFINRYDKLPITELTLVDISIGKEKLLIITQLAERMVKKANIPMHVTSTLDRVEALQNANFVITQIRVGGLDAREMDESIPLKHGVIGQETNGPGGIFKAFRTIPVLLEISKDIYEICPKAWLINFTNPAGIVTEAILKHSPHKKVVGVCNIPFNMKNSIAEIMNTDVDDVQITFIGMNHFVFGQKVYIKGVDQTEVILERLLRKNLDYSPTNIVTIGWSSTFINSLKMLPNPYHQYYFQHDEVLAKDLIAFREKGSRAQIVKQVEKQLFAKYQDIDLEEKPKELENRGGAYYSDAACSLIESLYTNKGDIQTVNTENRGAIVDLPDDSVIEVNAVITKDGPKPIAVGRIPDSIKGIIQQMKSFEQLVIEAAITGDYMKAYQSMVMNPLVTSEKKAKVIVDELLEAHQAYLPQFHN